ncbi:nicotinate-nucleotide adenylyltransferase [Paenibacillus aurantius]|uniref:Probable nicotinate-nucleotide adenylyltransferase n=1 Tax=Paenibacillus aurantius TaxID=2918900 RepID=A0AA96LHH9_9BACL|nr:nicotinate-nucleotide adenylyltransferase [Paenibacillus aurantius]WNQ13410.1 nicotinate-nucleotide adenylyltransferase [Paenibacillus aurantius]
MKVGIMGGTFDPIHLGHLLAAERAREQAGLDEVWFMPAHVPPHKAHAPKADAEARWEMVVRATKSHAAFQAVDFELRRGGTSYTIDTITELRKTYPDHQFFYIIGGDMVMYLPKWYRIGELARQVTFIGLERPGYVIKLEELPDEIRRSVLLVPMPLMEISSTDIRARRAGGQSIRYVVTEPVRDYIEGNGLYEA